MALLSPTLHQLLSLSAAELEAAPLISSWNEPQPSPQEYDCGCIAVVRVTDRDFLRRERPFEMRLVYECGRVDCERPADCSVQGHVPGIHHPDCARCGAASD